MRHAPLVVVTLVVGVALGLAIGLGVLPETPSDDPATPEREAAGGSPSAAPAAEPPAPFPREESPAEVTADAPGKPPAVDRARLVGTIRAAIRSDTVRNDLRGVLAELAVERSLPGGERWLLADPSTGALVLSAVLEAAGLVLDDGQRAALENAARVAAAAFAEARENSTPTERKAARRAVEARLEDEIADLLHSDQPARLREALDARSVTGTLPGGGEENTLSSTGVSLEQARGVVMRAYRSRLDLPEDAHAGIADAVSAYVDRVDALNRELAGRWGAGFDEALASGPTPHTEAARRAREAEDYARRELEARARLWALQADLERGLEPYLDEDGRRRLRETRPTGLRFVIR